ncbi:hypothetical protein AMTR_s00016p00217150 [Amborella trichopoda]|uniref:Uncharacterized protein n=1 Tax=Amborella trichopoda TaxID=13333 RepID=W1PGR4_AMBTC|nr:hypothetical protein AMTR_s00016p00217150 [Amborella trichopoda]
MPQLKSLEIEKYSEERADLENEEGTRDACIETQEVGKVEGKNQATGNGSCGDVSYEALEDTKLHGSLAQKKAILWRKALKRMLP